MPEQDPSVDARVARLERRLKRERSSREQAERIAEDGMRRLFQANLELDRRVVERTEELDAERVSAALSAAERAEFLRLMSRETRSPLNGVIGVMEVLCSNAESEQARAWASDGLDSASQLDKIMTRLLLFLELEEVQAAPMSSEEPGKVLTAVNSRWRHDALRAGLLLTTENYCDLGQRFVGHLADVNAIFDELISNAIKHGDPGLLEISSEFDAGIDSDSPPVVVFSVTDSGPGINNVAPLLDSNFHDYSNSQARGMGYSLIKRLAERTHAELVIDSEPGGRTAVSFMLPASVQ